MASRNKLVVLTNIPSPYRLPVFEQICRRESGAEVWFLAQSERNRSWKKPDLAFPHVFLRTLSISLVRHHYELHVGGVLWRLLACRPDVVVTTGYDQIAYWAAAFYCRLFGKKLVLWNGTTRISAENKLRASDRLKKFFVRMASAAVTYGTKASEYVQELGMEPGRIVTGCNAVDASGIQEKAEQIRGRADFLDQRLRYAKPHEKLYVCVSRLIHYKGVARMVEHWPSDVPLVIIGDGPDKGCIQNSIAQKNLTTIHVMGAVSYSEMPHWYALSDVLVFPTEHEPWGLVVNEALAAGLYVVTTAQCGSAYDLINEANGEIHDLPIDWSVVIAGVEAKDLTREHSVRSIDACSTEAYAESVLEAVRKALSQLE